MSATRIFSRLRSLLDVLISGPQDGQVLRYEAASEKWKNVTPAAGFNPHSPGPIGDVTPGAATFTGLTLGGDMIPNGSVNLGSQFLDKWLGNIYTLGNLVFYPGACRIHGFDNNGVQIHNPNGITTVAQLGLGGSTDNPTIRLYSVSDNTLALRNGTNGQTFQIYSTYTDDSNFRRAVLVSSFGHTILGAEGAGTGATGNDIYFQTNGANRWIMAGDGHFLAADDNAYDIGANGASRPRNVYVRGFLDLGGDGSKLSASALDYISTSGNFAVGYKLDVGTDVEVLNSSCGVILKSTDGTRFRVTVANDGTLVPTAL